MFALEPTGSPPPETPLEALRDVALFIDWENIRFSLTPRGFTPSIAAILDACGRFGRVVMGRAYADWQQPTLEHDPTALYVAGIEPIYVPVRRYREDSGSDTIKNSVDVRIAVDTMELVHTHPQIEVFVLASGDQDFLHVVNRLRSYGKRVVGLSVSWSASPRLVERVDHMILYDKELGITAPEVLETAGETARLLRASEAVTSLEHLEPETARQVVEAVARTLTEYRTNGRAITISGLGAELLHVLGEQLFRTAVRGRLQRITRELERHGCLQVVSRGVDNWLYLASEAQQSPALPAMPAPVRTSAPLSAMLDWSALTSDQQHLAIAIVDGLSQDAHLDYLTFSRIAEALDSSELGAIVNGRRLANTMIAASILVQDRERQWYDAFTGKNGTFWSVSLNREHEQVIQAIGHSQPV